MDLRFFPYIRQYAVRKYQRRNCSYFTHTIFRSHLFRLSSPVLGLPNL